MAERAFPPLETCAADWRRLRTRLPLLLPVALFSLGFGFTQFEPVTFTAIAAATLLSVALLSEVIARVQFRRDDAPERGYVLPASIGKRAGRLLIGRRGLSWWSYAARAGEPEWTLAWPLTASLTLRTIPAIGPISALQVVDEDGSTMELVLSARRTRTERAIRSLMPATDGLAG